MIKRANELSAVDSVLGMAGAIRGANSDQTDVRDYLKELRYAPDMDPSSYTRNERNLRKRRLVENLLTSNGAGNKTKSELYGPVTTTMATTATGAGIGSLLGRKKDKKTRLKYTAVGGGLGFGTGTLLNSLGSLAAKFTRQRKRPDLEDYYNSGFGTNLTNMLVPGVGSYNAIKNDRGADLLLEDYKFNPNVRRRIDRLAYGDDGYEAPEYADDFLLDADDYDMEEPERKPKKQKSNKKK